ncbi:MAG: hypothetical protein ACRD0B_03260, partial [Acidimicrobiales bacterium]
MSAAGSNSPCELVSALAPELALGTLGGAERAAALAHLEDCPCCRELVDGLAKTADALLVAARELDPPLGFEVRLLDRLRAVTPGTPPGAVAEPPAPPPPPERRRRRAFQVAAIAATAVIAAGAGIGIGIGLQSSSQYTEIGTV